MMEEDPSLPMQTLATRLNVHRTMVLRYKRYVLKVRQMLSEALKVNRLPPEM